MQLKLAHLKELGLVLVGSKKVLWMADVTDEQWIRLEP